VKSIYIFGLNSCQFEGAVIVNGLEIVYQKSQEPGDGIKLSAEAGVPLTLPSNAELMDRINKATPNLFILAGEHSIDLAALKRAQRVSLAKVKDQSYGALAPGDLVLILGDLNFEKHSQIMVHLMSMGVGVISTSTKASEWGLEPEDDYFILKSERNFDEQILEILSLGFLRVPVIFRGYQKVVENFNMHSFNFSRAMFEHLKAGRLPEGLVK
jgi:hypothetical protein